MQATKKGNKLTIVVDLIENPMPSTSGKSLIHFKSGFGTNVGQVGDLGDMTIQVTARTPNR